VHRVDRLLGLVEAVYWVGFDFDSVGGVQGQTGSRKAKEQGLNLASKLSKSEHNTGNRRKMQKLGVL